jgi:hypothetical protein
MLKKEAEPMAGEHQVAGQTASGASFGFWVSIGTGAMTLLMFGIAMATPPLGGPMCKTGCFSYPYLDIAERFPRDDYWMFLGIVAVLFFLAFGTAILGSTSLKSPSSQ